MPASSPEEIHALIAGAFEAGDIDAFLDLHEQDAVSIVPLEGRHVSGHAEIRAALARCSRSVPGHASRCSRSSRPTASRSPTPASRSPPATAVD